VAGILLWSLVPPSPSHSESPAPTVTQELPSPAAATGPAAEAVSSPSPGSPGSLTRRTYALGLHELGGLPPNVAPGSALELWVTWEPPLTKAARVHLLLDDVVVERVIPPALPEGPTSVLISVPARGIPDLIYGDRFGELSAVTSG
jgi:hypothetical protein